MRTFIFIVISAFFLTIYVVSSSGVLMKNIARYRLATDGMLRSSKYHYGDLFGVSSLPGFKGNIRNDQVLLPIKGCNSDRNINLYCICDSYLYSFIGDPSIFCGVNKYEFTRWGLDEPLKIDIDTTKTNVLFIERAERFFRYIPLTAYLDRIHFNERSAHSNTGVPATKTESPERISTFRGFIDIIYSILTDRNLNQNLEFNIFDYIIFLPFKEMKAQLNYKLFGRTVKEVSLVQGVPYLFLSETLDPASGNSSFMPLNDGEVDSIVSTLNSTYKQFRNKGFDEVYFSIIPNPVTILCPNYKPYNGIISRVQGHPHLIMPMINIYDKLNSAGCQVYQKSDSHWNRNGFNLWVNEANKYLSTTRKAGKRN